MAKLTQTLAAWYEHHVLPVGLDFVCGLGRFSEQRDKVVPQARGRILEIGIGTGLNLPHYDRSHVDSITGVDPATELHRWAQRRAREAGLQVELVPLQAESLPFAEHSFDTVLVTYALCTIEAPVPALQEMRRVLKPEGRLIYCEHGLAPEDAVQRWQRRINPLWCRYAGGCQLDRDIPDLIRAAGFELVEPQSGYIAGPRPFTYNYWGQARALVAAAPSTGPCHG